MFYNNIPDDLLKEINVNIPIFKNSKNELFSFDADRPGSMTLLHRAISCQSFKFFDYMLALGADMTLIDNMKNETPLHYAANINDCYYLQKLIKHYKDTNLATDEEGHVAKRQKLSLSLSEWINLQNNEGKSALYLAITSSETNFYSILLLLENGGDLFLADFSGVTPIGAAYLNLHKAESEEEITAAIIILNFLNRFISTYGLQEKFNQSMNSTQFMQKLIAKQTEQSHIAIVGAWIRKKKSFLVFLFLEQIKKDIIQERDQSGKTLLHHAAAVADLPVISLLFANRDEYINASSVSEVTDAISSDSENIIVLKEPPCSKSIDLLDYEGNTPLDEIFSVPNATCDQNEVEERKKCFLLLLEKGANVFAGNKRIFENDIVELQEKLHEYFLIESICNLNIPYYKIAVAIRENLRKIFWEKTDYIDFTPRPGKNFEEKIVLNFIQDTQYTYVKFYLILLKHEFTEIVPDKEIQLGEVTPILAHISEYAKSISDLDLFLQSTTYPEITTDNYLNTPENRDGYNIFRFSNLNENADIEKKKLIIDQFFYIHSVFNKSNGLDSVFLPALELLPVDKGGDVLRDYFGQLALRSYLDNSIKEFDTFYNTGNRVFFRDDSRHETANFLAVYNNKYSVAMVRELNVNELYELHQLYDLYQRRYPCCVEAIRKQYSLVEKQKIFYKLGKIRDDFLSANIKYIKETMSEKLWRANYHNRSNRSSGEFVLLVDLLIETNDRKKLRLLLLSERGFFEKLLNEKMAFVVLRLSSNKELSSSVFSFKNLLEQCSLFNGSYMKSSVAYFNRQIEKTWQPRLESIRKALSIKEEEFALSKTRRDFFDAEIESIIEQLNLFQQQLYAIYSDSKNFDKDRRYPYLPGCINAPVLILDQVEERITSMVARYRLHQFEMLCGFLLNNDEKLEAFTNLEVKMQPRGAIFTPTTKAKASPLLQDVPEENFLIVRKMVELFPELLDVRDSKGRTSLHWAMAGVKTSTAYGDLLLELGADPYIQVYYARTAQQQVPFFATFFSGATLEVNPQTKLRVVPALPNINANSPLEKMQHSEGKLKHVKRFGAKSVFETGRKQVFMHVLKQEAENINRTTWTNMFNHVLNNTDYRKFNGLEDKPTNTRGRRQ